MSRTTRIRRSAEQWRALIAEQADCGLSQSAFCKRKRLSLSTFTLWKRRLSETASGAGGERRDLSTWIDLGSLGTQKPGWDIELDLGDGICLRFRRG